MDSDQSVNSIDGILWNDSGSAGMQQINEWDSEYENTKNLGEEIK